MSWKPSTCGKRSDGNDSGHDDITWEKVDDEPRECDEHAEAPRPTRMREQRGGQRHSTTGSSWDPWAHWNQQGQTSWEGTWSSRYSNWGAWGWSSVDYEGSNHDMFGKGGGSEAVLERPVQSRGFGTPEQVKKTMAEVLQGRQET